MTYPRWTRFQMGLVLDTLLTTAISLEYASNKTRLSPEKNIHKYAV